jgi:predicted house-cleaning NTP pyrophosphatase (Maf/HAM1 superfamily)
MTRAAAQREALLATLQVQLTQARMQVDEVHEEAEAEAEAHAEAQAQAQAQARVEREKLTS